MALSSARAGSIPNLPIIITLSLTAGSMPGKDAARRLGNSLIAHVLTKANGHSIT